jgi:hypothetical protein
MALALKLNRARLAAWALLALFAGGFFYLHASFAQDDAYITYRYARNLAEGRGFVYNPGEPVLGTTTPLYTLVLALGAAATRQDVPTVSLAVGLLSVWAGAGALYELGQAHSKSLALAVGLLYLTNPFLSEFVGMESYFLVAMLLLAAWAYAGRRLWLASLVCGLLVLVRYEMILLVGLLALVDFRAERRLPWWLLPGLAPVVAWLAYAWLQFGSPIPLSAQAKLAATRVPFALGAAVFEYYFVTSVPADLVLILLAVLGAIAALVLRRLLPRYGLVALFGVLYFCLVSPLAGSFPWYYAPLVPAFAVLVAAGLGQATDLAAALSRRWRLLNAARIAAGLRWLLILAVVGIQLIYWRNDDALRQRQPFDHRSVAFQQVAQWLNQNASPRASLASFEIGYLGYYTDLKIIDFAGLVTPGLLAWAKDGSNVALAQCLRLYAPDYVLVPSDDAPQLVIMSQDARYQLVREFQGAYRLYRRAAT